MSVAHLRLIRSLPCIVSGMLGVEAHHVRSGSICERIGITGRMRNSDWLALPLATRFHTGECGIHRIGVVQWEQEFDTQANLIDKLGAMLKLDLWALAAQEIADRRANRKYKPPADRSKPDADPDPLSLGRMKSGWRKGPQKVSRTAKPAKMIDRSEAR